MRPASPLLQPEKTWFNTPKSEPSLSLCSYDVLILSDCLCVFAAKFPEISMIQRSLQQPQSWCLGQVASCTALCVQPSSWDSALNWGSCWGNGLCLAQRTMFSSSSSQSSSPDMTSCDCSVRKSWFCTYHSWQLQDLPLSMQFLTPDNVLQNTY